MSEYDVCVIGGGPAGAVAALRLATWGCRVCLVEKARFPRRHVGESLSPGLLPMLDPLGLARAVRGCAHAAGETWLAWEKPEPQRLASTGAGTLLVDRAVLDPVLLQAAAAGGVRVIQPARAIPSRMDDGWRVELADQAEAFRARFIIDAAGRRGALPGRRVRFSPPLQALWSHWPGQPGDPVRVEAIARGWLWAAPVGPHSTSLLFFGDPGTLRPGARPLESLMRDTLAGTALFRREAGAAMQGAIERCDATCTHAREPLGADFIRIGEASYTLDPLSSSGVEKAVQTALQGASIVQTLLHFPERYELCARFYRERQTEAVTRHAHWNAQFYREVERFAEQPFWASRRASEPAATPLPRPRPLPAAACRLRLAHGVSLAPKPCLVDRFIESREGLRAPRLERPVVFFEGIEIAPLLRSFGDGATLEQWKNQWAPKLTEARSERLAAWLWEYEILEPSTGSS